MTITRANRSNQKPRCPNRAQDDRPTTTPSPHNPLFSFLLSPNDRKKTEKRQRHPRRSPHNGSLLYARGWNYRKLAQGTRCTAAMQGAGKIHSQRVQTFFLTYYVLRYNSLDAPNVVTPIHPSSHDGGFDRRAAGFVSDGGATGVLFGIF